MNAERTDVLVIGSGFGAAAPALRLAAAGHRVLVLEKGPDLVPERDFRQTQDPNYFRRYLKSAADPALSLTWAEALGGGSGFYEMVSLRAPSRAFEQRDAGGHLLWPRGLDRARLDPYYERAERELGVEQIAPADVPRNGLLFARLFGELGLPVERARYAVRGCVGSGFCIAGCVYRAKRALFENYLPAARRAGATIRTGIEVEELRPIAEVHRTAHAGPMATLPYRYEARCRAVDGGRCTRVRARVVVLAGGTVGTAALLVRSRPHLPRLGSQLGRNIAFNGSVKVAALLPPHYPDGDMYSGRSHPGVVSYAFLESHGLMVTTGKALPLQVAASVRMSPADEPPGARAFGAPHVEMMRLFRRRALALVAFGLTPPEGRLQVDAEGRVRVALEPSRELLAARRRSVALLESLLVRGGARLLRLDWLDGKGRPYAGPHFSTAHQVGSCRMADHPDRGVVDRDGEVFGYPGLFVSDGAAIPSSLAVNTSLTILANAERIAERIARRHPGAGGPSGPLPGRPIAAGA
jgi:choline dehydrogenase-like flavoprotein